MEEEVGGGRRGGKPLLNSMLPPPLAVFTKLYRFVLSVFHVTK